MSRDVYSSRPTSRRRAGWSVGVAGALTLAGSTLVWAFVGHAHAAFPGANGRIVFASQRADRQYELHTMTSDGTNRRQIGKPTTGENPKYSRGGTRIAFVRDRDIYVMNFDGTGVRNLTKHPSFDTNPSWSPDDKWIAFARRGGGRFDVYVVRVDGGAPAKNLTNSPAADDRGPAWSPDGKRIAYERDGQIRVMSSDGKGARALTARGRNVSPAWSPDGKRIAFAGRVTDDGDWEIYVMSADGTNVSKPLGSHPDIDLDPAWSPDGKQIAFTSTRGKSYDVHVMSADGNDVRQLMEGPAEDTTPDWQSLDRGPIETGVIKIVADKCSTDLDTGTSFRIGPRLLVTADHVVAEEGRVARKLVLMQGSKRLGTAVVLGRDTRSDLALLRASKRLSGHTFRFAVTKPTAGDEVVVHGYPPGASRIARPGRVDQIGQATDGEDGIRRVGLIQVGVDIPAGVSGGPLVRDEGTEEAGHVLGVVIQRDEGDIAFAVPAKLVESKIARWQSAKPLRPARC